MRHGIAIGLQQTARGLTLALRGVWFAVAALASFIYGFLCAADDAQGPVKSKATRPAWWP